MSEHATHYITEDNLFKSVPRVAASRVTEQCELDGLPVVIVEFGDRPVAMTPTVARKLARLLKEAASILK